MKKLMKLLKMLSACFDKVCLGLLFTVNVAFAQTFATPPTIPLTFKHGDVMSPDVLNSLLSRVNQTVGGYTTGSDIAGVWSCNTISIRNSSACISNGFTATAGGVALQRKQNISFSCSNNVCRFNAPDFSPFACDTSGSSLQNQQFELSGSYILISGFAIQPITKLSPTQFVWNTSQSEITNCSQNNQVPSPISNLSAIVSGTSVSLSWSDSNTDQTGYIVKRSANAGLTWTTVATITSASTLMYADSGLAIGSYQYQVYATNSNGNSIGSSVVPAVVTGN